MSAEVVWLVNCCAQPSLSGGVAAVTLVTRHWAAVQNVLFGLLTAAAAHGRYSARHLGHRYFPCFVAVAELIQCEALMTCTLCSDKCSVDGDSVALPPTSPGGVLCCPCGTRSPRGRCYGR